MVEDIDGTMFPRVGVATLIRNDGKILLGRRKNISGSGKWGAVGGRLEFMEALEDCAEREIWEEVGISTTKPQFAIISNDIFKDENRHYITAFFVCDYLSGELENKEPDKLYGWGWFSWERLPDELYEPVKNLKEAGFNPFSFTPVLFSKSRQNHKE